MDSTYKIVFILAYKEREQRAMSKVKSEITRLNPLCEVTFYDCQEPNLVIKILELRPNIIIHYPFTATSTSLSVYLLKYVLEFTLVCFRTEGIANYDLSVFVELMAGKEPYGASFVDYELFWGKKSAHAVGNLLYKQKKISSLDRILYFGAPLFEEGYQSTSLMPDQENLLSNVVKDKLNQYSKEKILLFVTGFGHADYTEYDIKNCGDFLDNTKGDAENDFTMGFSHVSSVILFRQKWIDAIVLSATKNPKSLFVIKVHPMEVLIHRMKKIEPYKALEAYENVLLIKTAVPFRALATYGGILFHYDSTTSLDAYLSNIPSVYYDLNGLRLGSKRFGGVKGLGIPYSISVPLENLPALIAQHAETPIKFERSEAIEQYLYEQLDFEKDKPYKPSVKIASFLLSLRQNKPQAILASDKYLIHAVQKAGYSIISYLFNKGVSITKTGEYNQALEWYFDKALELSIIGNTRATKIQYLRAICLYQIGLFDEATHTVNKALQISPNEKILLELKHKLKLNDICEIIETVEAKCAAFQ